jgi:hypothetical protein
MLLVGAGVVNVFMRRFPPHRNLTGAPVRRCGQVTRWSRLTCCAAAGRRRRRIDRHLGLAARPAGLQLSAHLHRVLRPAAILACRRPGPRPARAAPGNVKACVKARVKVRIMRWRQACAAWRQACATSLGLGKPGMATSARAPHRRPRHGSSFPLHPPHSTAIDEPCQ